MPLYEYQCQNCKHQCEQLESIHAETCQTCPQCQKRTLQRQVSQSHFQLKGSGWYVTDFKDNKKNSTQKPETKNSDSGSKQ